MSNPDKRNDKRPRRTRRAATLIEVLALLALLVVITDFSVRMVRNFAADIPRTYRDFQTNTALQDMLRQLRKDVEAAGALGQVHGESGDPALAVTLADEVVLYDFADGRITRTPADDPSRTPSHVWPVPRAVVRWDLLPAGQAPRAVEITTSLERTVLGRHEKRLQNAHVFFVGLSGGEK